MNMTPIRTGIAVVALSGALLSCGEPVEPFGEGALELGWQVSPMGCEASEVDLVEIELSNARRSYVESYPCARGEAALEGLAPGSYELMLRGFDAGGANTFESAIRAVTVRPERIERLTPVALSARPAELEVVWRFENGRVCGANGVGRVEVAVYDEAFYEMARQDFDCNLGTGTIGELFAGEYIVQANASAAEVNFSGDAQVSLKRGQSGQVETVLQSP
ncbi:hypothetical protein FRC98_09325 [Lujinxingia vulgaris]|uniref:Lipoprotein n=1 Tax=Lujinxingia vulgaris TaxID=2600176 RepID=A0A5C6X930_9DELT|nr:hypothetical protein [Lujinxingia vulgaris]TXD37868.1 hypothetical protein FRC98_09325 [Lujinxingia vulgaris]